MAKNVGVIVGSLRKESWNLKLAHTLIQLAPASLHMEIIEIASLPLYNQDPDDHGKPYSEWTAFREKVKVKDGILFVTPEYNRSIPAPLKNAVDVGSRPYGQSVWNKKPCAVISASPSAIGGFGANHHLRQTFVFLDMFCLQQPESYIGGVDKLFDANGKLVKEDTRVFLQKFIDAYAEWVEKIASK